MYIDSSSTHNPPVGMLRSRSTFLHVPGEPDGPEVLEHFFQIASNAAMFISNERGKNAHYNDTSFVFIGAVFQKLRHFKHSFLDVRGMMREGRKKCDGLTFLCYSCWKTNS